MQQCLVYHQFYFIEHLEFYWFIINVKIHHMLPHTIDKIVVLIKFDSL